MHSVRISEKYNLHKTVCCEGGILLKDIGTKNVREYELIST